MNLYQRRYIPTSDPWEPYYFGTFFTMDSTPCFLYKDKGKVCLLPLTCKEPMIIDVDITSEFPCSWVFLYHDDQPFLFVKSDIVIDLKKGKQLPFISDALQTKYIACARPEMYFEEHKFSFNDYCISHKGNSGYQCSKAGEVKWEFAGKAYLYTDIIRWNNRIFFGTAGNGGYFYILDLDTGTPVASIKTGVTASIAQMGHLCFVARRGVKRNCSQLLCVDLRDGRVIEEFDLQGGVTKDSKLQMIGQQLHIVTFEYKGDKLQTAIWNTVSI